MSSVTFILHKPQLSENIGACARAIKNFNFNKLSIIDPKPLFPNDKIVATSVGAKEIIKNCKVYDNLESSIKKIDYLVATSARFRNKNIKHINLNDLSKLDFSKLDNKKLCLLAAEHDEKAFEFLIKNNSEFMMGVCHRFCDSDHEAQEIFQRACIKAWKSFPKFRADCNFKTWIYTIIRSASFDHNRWKKRKAEVSLDSCYGLGSRDQNESGDTEVPKKRGGLSISSSLEWENNKGNKRWGKTLFEMVVESSVLETLFHNA